MDQSLLHRLKPMSLRVAAVQAEAVTGDVDANLQKAVAFARGAAEAGAALVVFPEAFTTGYDDAVFSGDLPRADDLAWLDPVQRIATETGVVVVLNSPLDRGDRRTLTDLIVGPDSVSCAAYDKQHLYENEREVFSAGVGGASLVLQGVRIALSVCYDANFPEHAADAAGDGVVVYVNSGAYFPGGESRRDLHYGARALDNGIYVVFAGLVGGAAGFIGGAAIFDPSGAKIAGVIGDEGLAIADIDISKWRAVRQQQQMWADRRPSLGPRETVVLS
jgi:predicted amidohydrolase